LLERIITPIRATTINNPNNTMSLFILILYTIIILSKQKKAGLTVQPFRELKKHEYNSLLYTINYATQVAPFHLK